MSCGFAYWKTLQSFVQSFRKTFGLRWLRKPINSFVSIFVVWVWNGQKCCFYVEKPEALLIYGETYSTALMDEINYLNQKGFWQSNMKFSAPLLSKSTIHGKGMGNETWILCLHCCNHISYSTRALYSNKLNIIIHRSKLFSICFFAMHIIDPYPIH